MLKLWQNLSGATEIMNENSSRKIIPNIITIIRLLLVPVFVVSMIGNGTAVPWISVVLFAFAAATDYLDGYLARKFKAISQLGQLLDPLVDKILVMSALVMLVGQGYDLDGKPWIYDWMVVLVLAREIWVTGLRSVAASKGVVIPAGSLGKYKSWFQMVSIPFLLIHYSVEVLGFTIDMRCWGIALFSISLIFAVWSGVIYTKQVFGLLKL